MNSPFKGYRTGSHRKITCLYCANCFILIQAVGR